MTDAPSPARRLTYRQRSPQAMAWVFIAVAAFLVYSLALSWSRDPAPLFAAWIALGLAVVWSVFLRPAVALDQEGVTLRNILRDVHIPWPRVTDVEARWNVQVFVEDRAYTAWAISSQAHRPAGMRPGFSGMLSPGRAHGFGGGDAPAPPKVTARTVADAIEETKLEYDAALAAEAISPPADTTVTRSWVPAAVVPLLVSLVAVVMLTVL